VATWLVSALSLLRGFAGRVTGRSALALGTGAAGAAAGIGLADPRGGLFPDIFGGDRPRRRRRRRALTASDRADIAFIAGLLGPKAGKDFSVSLVAGLTR